MGTETFSRTSKNVNLRVSLLQRKKHRLGEVGKETAHFFCFIQNVSDVPVSSGLSNTGSLRSFES